MTENVVHPGHRLGKQARRDDPRTLRLARYLDVKALPPVPAKVTNSTFVPTWPMYMNDQLGSCGPAGAGHLIQLVTAMGGAAHTPTDAEVLRCYSDVGGYRPGDPSTDNGVVLLDLLNYWRKTGIGGHRIDGFAAFDPHNYTEYRLAAFLFGAGYVGYSLPISAQAQVGRTWTAARGTNGAAGSWGGHCVITPDVSATAMSDVTWGALQRATKGFEGRYCDEAYVVWDHAIINIAAGKAPNGFNADQLVADLSQFS